MVQRRFFERKMAQIQKKFVPMQKRMQNHVQYIMQRFRADRFSESRAERCAVDRADDYAEPRADEFAKAEIRSEALLPLEIICVPLRLLWCIFLVYGCFGL
jgi:hypothetical protein